MAHETKAEDMIMAHGHQSIPGATVVETTQDILHMYDLVKQTGVPNFMGARIPLEHGLHICTWRQYANKLQAAGFSQANDTVVGNIHPSQHNTQLL